MCSNLDQNKFKDIIQQCSEKMHPTRDDDMYIFYMGICFVKKAIDQADASIKMELTDEEAKHATYREKADRNISKIEELLQKYVCDVKGFEDAKYYVAWLKEMHHVSEAKSEWLQKARNYAYRLHPYILHS